MSDTDRNVNDRRSKSGSKRFTRALVAFPIFLVAHEALALEPETAAGAPEAKDGVRDGSEGQAQGTDLERDLVDEINRLRVNPGGFIPLLEERAKRFRGAELHLPGRTTLLTQEGVAAVEEAIAALKSSEPIPPLSPSRGLSQAAVTHALDLGQSGQTGHAGSDGSSPSDRFRRFGTWKQAIAENISFGEGSGRDVVLQLVVDDGVVGRGHRANLLKADFRRVGIACRQHPTYRHVCVIDFAGEFEEYVGPGDRPVLPGEARVGADATKVVFALQTGSCWGSGEERRTVEIESGKVTIRSGEGRPGVQRSLAWWEETRGLLNQGLSASREKPENGDCYVPNWICGFEIQVFSGRKKVSISGCCNTSALAGQVLGAFRRLKPGGPLGPDEEPVP